MSDKTRTATTEWTYWCPHEGTHVVDPAELWVGIVDEDSNPLLVAAVVPPVVGSQMEGFAAAIRDALRAKSVDWTQPDMLADWLHAHGFTLARSDWPSALDNGSEGAVQ